MRAYVVVLGAALAGGCGEVPAAKPDAAVCMTAADCTDPSTPYCVDSKCVAACSVNSDCTDPAHAICASDGACVACTSNTDCTMSTAPVCDTQARECRGCSKDSECTGGVCVEAEGTCAADADVAFVTMMGTDTGTCTRAAPCATVQYAIGQAGTRRVIHVLGGSLQQATALNLTGNRVLDGEDTTFVASGTPITITAPATVVVEGFRVAAPNNMTAAINVTGAGAKAVLYNLNVTGPGGSIITGGNSTEITLRRSRVGSLSTVGSNQISCQNGKILVDQNTFENTYVVPFGQTTCDTTVTRNRFESGYDGSVQQTGGHLIMENNLIIHTGGFNDSISVGGLGAGSTIRFNTIVNTTAVSSDGAALNCDASANVTSNIFAYNSMHSITGSGCSPRYSVFDDVSTASAGTGNQIVGIETIFVNRMDGDYHLAASSVARGGAEPGLTMVTTDYEGKPRPAPSGSTADCGAFEAP